MPSRKKRDNRLFEILRKADMFGEPLYFNMNGQREYRTCLGAWCTLLIITFMGFVAAMLARSVYGK